MNKLLCLCTVLLVAASLWIACDDDADPPAADGRAEQLPVQDQSTGQDGDPSSAVDFVVQGCAELSASQCRGTAPLTLTFSAVLLSKPTSVSWDFGDSSPAQTGLVVTHHYASPGTHDVTLTIGASGGTVSEQKSSFVVVAGAGPGAPCASNSTCASGTCICDSSCAFPLADGLCLHTCSKQTLCPFTGKLACIDLSAGVTATKDPWRTQLCLPLCTTDSQCQRTGFSCRLAPGVYGWHRVCMPPLLGFIGTSCKTASGVGKVDHSRCLGGTCLDLGAGGYCTAPCLGGSCPSGTRCARFTKDSKKPVCLLRCDGSNCTGDPLLACEVSSQSGQYGFEVMGTQPDPKGTRYCAPRRCKQDKECGLAGVCDSKSGGFCVLK